MPTNTTGPIKDVSKQSFIYFFSISVILISNTGILLNLLLDI